jgi:hypothetical protein
MNLTNEQLSTQLQLQLGVDVYEEDGVCGFCAAVNDRKGIHARSCMSGGDHDLQHNACRDATHAFCRRGRLRPVREQVDLLTQPGEIDGRRPADVLICAEMGSPTVAEQAGARPCRRHALDFAVINPMGMSRASRARGGERPAALRAARAYAEGKRRAVEARCQEEGIRFYPMVLETTGGIEDLTAAPTFHQIASAVAEREGAEVSTIKGQLMERISMELVRSATQAVLRRAQKKSAGRGQQAATAMLRREARLTWLD